jgi:hypothetical protein
LADRLLKESFGRAPKSTVRRFLARHGSPLGGWQQFKWRGSIIRFSWACEREWSEPLHEPKLARSPPNAPSGRSRVIDGGPRAKRLMMITAAVEARHASCFQGAHRCFQLAGTSELIHAQIYFDELTVLTDLNH